jgi:uncharacterized membrane protein
VGSLSQAKSIGGVGSILIILAIVPVIGSVLSIIGLILVLIAVKYISDTLKDRSIFDNAIIAVVLAIVGIAIGAFVLFASLFSVVSLGGMSQFSSFTPGPEFSLTAADMMRLALAVLVPLTVLWIFSVVSTVFLRRSFNTISSKLNVGMFHTAALLFLIGAITVVVLVGFLIILIGAILQAIAFFSIPDQVSGSSTSST